MSTPTLSSGRAASEDAGDHLEAHHLPLPTFHSIRDNSSDRDARTDSTASGSRSRRSNSRNGEPDRSRLLERFSFASGGRGENDAANRDKDKDKDKEKEKENDAPRRNTVRSSGGFLVEPISDAQPLSPSLLNSSLKPSKRERTSEDGGLVVSKRKQRNNGPSNSSFRSSPLASEVRRDPVVQRNTESDALVPGTDIRRSLSSSHTDSNLSGGSPSAPRKPDLYHSPMARVGNDTDPAQIVNMALSLSEGRRRLASGRRYVSTEHGERRVVSGASTLGPRDTVRRKSIAPFLATKRQASQNGSPKPKFTAVFKETSPSPTRPASAASAVKMDEDAIMDDEPLDEHISPATAFRVEKAKIYFELAHEHRRILPHLPPLRKPGAAPLIPPPAAFQKAYNPLQYVRNRKLRIWEKTPIDSEADGWHDVQKVRTWVDAVVSSHTETQHDNLECVRLPPLDQKAVKDDSEDPDESPDELKTSNSPRLPEHLPYAKPSRPRSDWVTHPADMIADAYWLEQGMNKSKIQDRDNNLIYPAHTNFIFSGWRNTGPVEVPSRLQLPSPPAEISPIEAPPSALPELPTFKSAHHKHKIGRHGRRRDVIKDSLQTKDTSSSRDRSRIRRKLFRDSSDSESSRSSSSDTAGTERGRKRLRRKRGNGDLEQFGSHSLSTNSPHGLGLVHGDSSQGSSAHASKRSSLEPASLNKFFNVDSFKKASPLNRSQNRQDSSRPHSKITTRSSLEHERHPRASTDYDTATAPNSPNGVEWPSIAINLSPPPSRPVSPTRKHMSTILHPFHRKPHKEHEQISTADFAHAPAIHSNNHHPHESEEDKHSESPGTHGTTSPMTRGVSPMSKHHTNSTQPDDTIAPHSSNEQRWYGTASKVSTRSNNTGSDHSRLRGIFKGGRIAEIVGNEVSRVGDFIWKRDPPSVYKHRTASEASLRSFEVTDSDKETHLNGTVPKILVQENERSRSSTVSSTKSERATPTIIKTSPPSNDRPRYITPNLPSFTSPFQKDRERQDKKQTLLSVDEAESPDHISRIAAQHRSASHSPRLDRIPLPRLDTRSPPTPNGIIRQKSYGFGAVLDLTRSQDASEMLNNAIGPVAGLQTLRPSRSTGNISRAGSDVGQDGEPGGVSWRDINRASAFLYSSTVKAREIGRRADDTDGPLPKILLDSLTPENRAMLSSTPLLVKRREYHIVAAQNIMKTLEGHSSTLSDKLHSFSASVAPILHTQLQRLEDEVENNMTPQVRITADQAGELSMKLNTTSTLAVKELHDTIERAFRRKRRGPVRLFRKLWFAGIEWTVVGVLWLIWAVVSTIRLALGSVRCVLCVVSWLLWIQ